MKSLILALGLILLAGCIRSTRHDMLVVTEDDAVTWTVIERNVRSDKTDPAERLAEETKHLAPIAEGNYRLYQAFPAAGGVATTCDLVRAKRPYVIYTEGAFTDLEAVGRAILQATQLGGTCELTREGRTRTWRLTLYKPAGELPEATAEAETAIALLAGIAEAEFLLDVGRFTAATNFEVDDNGEVARIATEALQGTLQEAGETLELSLTWELPATEGR